MNNSPAQALAEELMQQIPELRYVAIRKEESLALFSRDALTEASDTQSDRFEELVVNPTLITLLSQRGAIDCGGFRFACLRYGNFWAVVVPIAAGHITIGLEPHGDPVAAVQQLQSIVEKGVV